MNNYVIIIKAGLCNTIKSIISYFRILENNKNSNKIIKVYDKNYNSLSLTNNEIFPGSLMNIFENIEEMNKVSRNFIKIRTWRIKTFKTDNLKDDIFYCFKDKYSNIHGDIDLMYNKTPEKLKKSILLNLKKLIIKKEILNKVDVISKKFNDKTISVQINPIRIYTALKNNPNFKSIDMENHMRNENSFIYDIIKKMKMYDDSYNFYVSLSYKPLIDIFIKEFGKRIIFVKNNQNRNWDTDMIDLLLLSKNKVIIGTALSTFCELAWYYSDCKSDVILVGNYNFVPKKLYIK